MKRALLLHCDIVRRVMIDEKGFEVKGNGDSFLIAFVSTSHATKFVLKIQTGILLFLFFYYFLFFISIIFILLL